jgi:type I restriction enzyme S subunit
MRKNYKRLGDYIQLVNIRDVNIQVDKLLGVSVKKIFIPSIANLVGTDMSTYKIIKKRQFAYIPDTSRRGDKIGIALLEEYDEAIVSQAYTVFEISDVDKLLPEYLMMWFRRPEFDRYARFKSHGSAREIFDWNELCDTQLPIPTIDKQAAIVKEYHVLVDRINLNNSLIQKLEETAQVIYKQWFVEFEFPEPLTSKGGKYIGYKSSGGEMVESEMGDIPKGWRLELLSEIATYENTKVSIDSINKNKYISTENMLQNRGGIKEITNLPEEINITRFKEGNLLISNIRPYFKKIWLATFDGGCSNDILCFKSKNGISPEYLYSLLERDVFFEYVMAGSNGVKMPRGDKDWIMNYPILLPEKKLLIQYNENIEKFHGLITNHRNENNVLTEILNILLSKLATIKNKE